MNHPTSLRALRRRRAPRLLGSLALAGSALAGSALAGSALAGSVLSGAGSAGAAISIAAKAPARHPKAPLPPVRHVFVIILENESYPDTFGNPANDPYLATTLPHKGALLKNYYGIGHDSADNYIALISGQPPNPSTQGDCLLYPDFPAGTTMTDGIENGSGCVYPATVPNLPGQLQSAHFTWKGYMEDMGNIPTRESAACGHPTIGVFDTTELAALGDGYATRHDPFMYFHSIIDHTASCDAHVVALGSPTGVMPATALPGETGLAHDLRSVKTTPNFSLIIPNLCEDGHDLPCKNETGAPTRFANIDGFLSTWVPKITSSPAFKANGLLIVTFDESEGANADSTACCNEIPGPAAPNPGTNGPGGGHIGAVLISPFIKPGTVTTTPYNHFSTLATIEKLFRLPLLGEARTVSSTFGPDVFTHSPKAH